MWSTGRSIIKLKQSDKLSKCCRRLSHAHPILIRYCSSRLRGFTSSTLGLGLIPVFRLRVLNLQFNQLGDASAYSLGAALQFNNVVTEIELWKNKIQSNGILDSRLI